MILSAAQQFSNACWSIIYELSFTLTQLSDSKNKKYVMESNYIVNLAAL